MLIEPSQAPVRMQWGLKIPLRDGVRLNATLYLPEHCVAPAPTLVLLTPYIERGGHDPGMYFSAHGYPFLIVDVRGRGDSEGVYRPFLDKADDGFDVVEWLARQPYCNGQVAMWGGSYAGYAQWATAKEFPPHLVTIVPVASSYPGVDFPMRSNIAPAYNLQWLTLVHGRALHDQVFADVEYYWSESFRRWFESGSAFEDLDTQLGNPSEAFQEWIAHPSRDAYWDSYSPTPEQCAKLSIPILTITGSYDGDQLGALMHYREHTRNTTNTGRARHYLVIGPWDHRGTRVPSAEFDGIKLGPASLLDMPKLHLEWYDWTMRRGPKPEFLRKNVAYYVMGAEKWRYADTLEAVTDRSVAFYLDSTGNPTDVFKSGSLSTQAPRQSEADHYVYDPRDVSLAKLESTLHKPSLVDQRMLHASFGKQLIYHSAPFEEDTEISGFFKLSVWLSIDQPDTDVRAVVYEIGLDGGAIQLTADWMRARYRENLREPKLITTRAPLRYDLDRFMFVSRQISKGHRLRLVIGPINSIYWQKNFNGGGAVSKESMKDARVVTVKLLHDEEHPSALYVPFAQRET